MKGKTHLIATFIIMSIVIAFSYRLFFEKISFLVILLSLLCVIIGSILPDADMKFGESKIFYSVFLPIALITRVLEYPLALLLKKPAKHRGVLHSPAGIIFSSLIVLGFAAVPMYFFSEINFIALLYLYLATVLSQALHIIEDGVSDVFPYMMIAAIVAAAYFALKIIV